MNVKPKIYALGNMDRKGELMEKKPSKAKSGFIIDQQPVKIFYRDVSKFDIKKLFDKIRGIKKAPDSVKTSLENLSKKNNQPLADLKNILESSDLPSWVKTTYNSGTEKSGNHEKNESPIIFTAKSNSEWRVEIDYERSLIQENPPITKDDTSSPQSTNVIGPPPPTDNVGPPPPSDDIGPPPPTDNVGSPPPSEAIGLPSTTDIDLDNILKELESLTAPPNHSQSELTKPTLNNIPKELGASAKDTNLENLKDKLDSQPTIINFKPLLPTKDNIKLAKRESDALELRYALKEMGLGDNGAIEKLKPRNKDIGATSNLNNALTITKQIHIDTLKKIIDLDQIKNHKNYSSSNELQRQVEYIETTINILASVSMQKKSESSAKGTGSLESLKLELKREFNKLLYLANKNEIEISDELSKSMLLQVTINNINHIDFIPKKKI